tara:strand:- start:397 stop:816 length:420 start_codon:yes stop_codon:yes gene_type:complete
MAFFRGEEGSVKFSKDGSEALATVISTTGWSLDITKDTLDVTAHGDNSRKFIGGLVSGSGTVDFLYTAATATDATGEILRDVLQADDPADAQFELFLTGSNKVTFNGVVTGTTLSTATGDLETVSVSFLTNGDINGNDL